MIKILEVLPFPVSVGGIERFILNLLANIDNTTFSVDLLLREGGEYKAFIEHPAICNHRVYTFPQIRKNFLQGHAQIARVFDATEYDVLHYHDSWIKTAYPLKIAYSKKMQKRIAHAHNAGISGVIPNVCHRINGIGLSKYSNIKLACSSAAARFMFGNHIDNVTIIPNGIEVEKFRFNADTRERIRKMHNMEDSFVIGIVARLCNVKNHIFLIKMISKIKERIPDIKLLIVGEGVLREKLMNETNELCVGRYVDFLGARENIGDYLSAFDVFALPSTSEGFGISLIEAQVNGLPCITSPYVPQEVKISDRLEFLSLDESIWIKKIMELALFDRIRKHASVDYGKFDIKHVVNMLSSIYES